jgi:hypothetical protein
VADSSLSRLGIPRHKVDRLVDPLTLSITCGHCYAMLAQFTRAGVLFDYCPECRRESRVPVRYADPVKAREQAEARGAVKVTLTLTREAMEAITPDPGAFIRFAERELARSA